MNMSVKLPLIKKLLNNYYVMFNISEYIMQNEV